MPAWTCPKCGTSWSDDTLPCARCLEPEAWVVAAPVRVTGPIDTGMWGRIRSVGGLLDGAVTLVWSNLGWILRLGLLAIVVVLPFAFWVGKAFSDRELRKFEVLLQRMKSPQADTLPAIDPAADDASLYLALGALVVVVLLSHGFYLGGLFGMLTAAGRGTRASLNRALSEGVRRAFDVTCVLLWMALRLIPWFLLLVIPGIVKLVAWSLAVPAYVSGAAKTPEEALRLSDAATRGRKWTVFLFLLLCFLLDSGLSATLTPSEKFLKLIGPKGSLLFLIIPVLLGILSVTVKHAGLWLAWGDAVAGRDSESPAAKYAWPGARG